jgi:transposase-like protein
MTAERNVTADHVKIWRWVQRYAPELNRRCRTELRQSSRSWGVDEIYLRVAGNGCTSIEPMMTTAILSILLSANRDTDSAKRFLQKALRSITDGSPRVINVDGNPSYSTAREFKLSAPVS